MKFLETITLFENDVLVPVDRIKFVNYSLKPNGGYVIKIVSDDGDFEEHFNENELDKSKFRYEMIKGILG